MPRQTPTFAAHWSTQEVDRSDSRSPLGYLGAHAAAVAGGVAAPALAPAVAGGGGGSGGGSQGVAAVATLY